MTLDPSSARLILFMLGKGASKIRPGEYTAIQPYEWEAPRARGGDGER